MFSPLFLEGSTAQPGGVGGYEKHRRSRPISHRELIGRWVPVVVEAVVVLGFYEADGWEGHVVADHGDFVGGQHVKQAQSGFYGLFFVHVEQHMPTGFLHGEHGVIACIACDD